MPGRKISRNKVSWSGVMRLVSQLIQCPDHEPVTSLDLEMNLVNQSHKDNLRHLPRLPGFFVTFRILSVVTTRMLALVISTIS